jgi:hypothetical protein
MLRIFSILNVQGFCVWLGSVLGLLAILIKPTASITTPIIIKIWENSTASPALLHSLWSGG